MWGYMTYDKWRDKCHCLTFKTGFVIRQHCMVGYMVILFFKLKIRLRFKRCIIVNVVIRECSMLIFTSKSKCIFLYIHLKILKSLNLMVQKCNRLMLHTFNSKAWNQMLHVHTFSVNFLIYCVAGRQFRTGLRQILRIQPSPRISEVGLI